MIWFLAVIDDCFATSNLRQPIDTSLLRPQAFDVADSRKIYAKPLAIRITMYTGVPGGGKFLSTRQGINGHDRT